MVSDMLGTCTLAAAVSRFRIEQECSLHYYCRSRCREEKRREEVNKVLSFAPAFTPERHYA